MVFCQICRKFAFTNISTRAGCDKVNFLVSASDTLFNGISTIVGYSYLPTPPLGQDMTQGQFFKRSLTGLNSEFFLLLDLLPHQAWRTQSALLFTHSWRENNWIHTFPKGINTMWNAINLVQELNSCRRVQFLRHRVKTVNALLKKSFLIILALWGGPPNFLMFGKYDTTSQLWSLQSVQLYF